MRKIEPWQAWAFLGTLAILATLINYASYSPPRERRPEPIPVRSIYYPPSPTPKVSESPAAKIEEPRKEDIPPREVISEISPTVESPEEIRAKFLARYRQPLPARIPGTIVTGIVVVNEEGKWNRDLARLIASHLETKNVKTETSPFTREFLQDGLFDGAFEASGNVFERLGLADFFDNLILAKISVEYSSDPSLENVITATMRLEVKSFHLSDSDDINSKNLSAVGAGFKKSEARSMAEERLIKQVKENPKLFLDLVNIKNP